LGIESSCDETAAAVVAEDGRVLSDVVQSQAAMHAAYGGVIPELASRDHARNVSTVVESALRDAGCGVADLSAIAVTHRPGLVGALLVGVQVAKGMAWAAKKPLVGVDHLVGHIAALRLRRTGQEPPVVYPFVCLLASGGHTALYKVSGPLPADIVELGATRDDAAGECFDKVAKLLQLGYPGGPAIDARARQGTRGRIAFPAPMAASGLEFSFSGIKSHAARHVALYGVPEGAALDDFCADFQGTVTALLAEKLVRAARREGVRAVAIAGGVAANGELRQRVAALSEAHGLQFHAPERANCTDNAAMIAMAGMDRHLRGEHDAYSLTVHSSTLLTPSTRKGRGRR
jgi:N6-L-threonylcarbamoyladenine synthase